MALERAVLFIDGSNFYHAAKRIGVSTGDLDYQKLANKLILNRELAGFRYYVGQVSGNFFPSLVSTKVSEQDPGPRRERCQGPNRAYRSARTTTL